MASEGVNLTDRERGQGQELVAKLPTAIVARLANRCSRSQLRGLHSQLETIESHFLLAVPVRFLNLNVPDTRKFYSLDIFSISCDQL